MAYNYFFERSRTFWELQSTWATARGDTRIAVYMSHSHLPNLALHCARYPSNPRSLKDGLKPNFALTWVALRPSRLADLTGHQQFNDLSLSESMLLRCWYD